MKSLKRFIVLVSLWGAVSSHADARSCTIEEKKAREIVSEDFGFKKITIHFENKGLCEQILELPNYISFHEATTRALESFLTDATHIESPLALMITHAFEDLEEPYRVPVPTWIMNHTERLLRNFINRPTTILRVIPLDEKPEQGEDPAQNWIFHLKMSDFSDHSYWAIVDREGFKKVYNYGFN